MKRDSNNKADFFDKVYQLVKKIPFGKVTTYGIIAENCGIKISARTVGWALNKAKFSNLPCHRVVNRRGELTGKFHFGDPKLMQTLLESEGIEFINEHVNLKKFLWKPNKSNTFQPQQKKRHHQC